MDNAYDRIADIWRKCTPTDASPLLEFIPLLYECHIKPRQHGDILMFITLSLPARPGEWVIGLRYQKSDGTWSEDHFDSTSQRDGMKLNHHKKRKLEWNRPEYLGAHKAAPGFGPPKDNEFVTDPSTYSFAFQGISASRIEAADF